MLSGFHATVGGLTFTTYDTIFAFAGLLFILGGLACVVPLRHAGRPAEKIPVEKKPEVPATEPGAGASPA